MKLKTAFFVCTAVWLAVAGLSTSEAGAGNEPYRVGVL